MFSGHDNHLCMRAHTHVHIHMYIHIMSAYACLRNANPFQKKQTKHCVCACSLLSGASLQAMVITWGAWPGDHGNQVFDSQWYLAMLWPCGQFSFTALGVRPGYQLYFGNVNKCYSSAVLLVFAPEFAGAREREGENWHWWYIMFGWEWAQRFCNPLATLLCPAPSSSSSSSSSSSPSSLNWGSKQKPTQPAWSGWLFKFCHCNKATLGPLGWIVAMLASVFIACNKSGTIHKPTRIMF